MTQDAAAARLELPVAMPFRTARLSRNAPTPFELRPDRTALRVLAGLIGVSHLRKVSFAGTLEPMSGGGWELNAQLGASVVQPCGVTLVPVTTRIDERVSRRFLPDYAGPSEAEAELPEDVDAEPLGAVIDPAAVMVEALALAVPPFPRAEGAELGAAVFAAPGVVPMTDADAHPMAGLAALRDRLKR
jgi:uncharacterized metal-binding protein YceD (DUF177 family)